MKERRRASGKGDVLSSAVAEHATMFNKNAIAWDSAIRDQIQGRVDKTDAMTFLTQYRRYAFVLKFILLLVLFVVRIFSADLFGIVLCICGKVTVRSVL